MKKIKMLITCLLIFVIPFSLLSCVKSQKKPEPKTENGSKPMPPIIEEIESDIITIINQVDLIPYYNKQIAIKKQKKQERKKIEIIIGQKLTENMQGSQNQESKGQSQDGGKDKSNQSEEKSDIEKLIEFKPTPITMKDTLLKDILKQELTDEKDNKTKNIPDDIVFIWNEINTKISDLHEKWNNLEPIIIKAGVSQESIKAFEDTLNKLTIAGSEYKHMETLMFSNKLTSYIPDFINNFKKKVPSPIYHMKYYVRQVILDSSIKNYKAVNEDFKKIKIYKDALISQLIDKKMTDQINKLNTSVSDLEDALKIKDMSIIKIKARVVMKNIYSIRDELHKK